MAEFKENLTQREEINIKPDNQGQMFDKSNLYKSQLAVMDSYSNISQNLFTNIDKVNNQQKNILSNKIRINFDTFMKNEQQLMATDPKKYYGNYAENQARGKKQLEDTFGQINKAGLFTKVEMDNLAVEMQGQYNNYFLQNNMNYARYQRDSAITSTREVNETYKNLIQSNSDDILGTNRYLSLMEESMLGLGDFLEPEALFKEQMEFANYKDTVAQNRIENYLDNSAASLEKDLQRRIANGATLDEITKYKDEYVNKIKGDLTDPDFSLGLVQEANFEGTVSKNFLNPVVNRAFDNAQNQVVVNDVFTQVMALVEKTGNTKDIESHINTVTLENLNKLYKEGNVPAEKVMQIKSQVLGKLDEIKASDIMKKYIGSGTQENFMKMQKKGAELQLDPQKNGLSGYGNVGASVNAALQMEQINVAENAAKAARAVVRSRGGATSSRSSSKAAEPTMTINSSGVLVQQPGITSKATFKGNMFAPLQSTFTMQGANAVMGVMKQNGVINSTTGGSKDSRKMYKNANNVVKTWNERGSAAIQTFMPNLMKDGVVTQNNQYKSLIQTGGVITKSSAKAGLELAYTSFTNVGTRDTNNNLMFTPKQMYQELVQRSNMKDAEGKRSMRRFTLFNEFSPEIQKLSAAGYGANTGISPAEQMEGIREIHNYFNDPNLLDPEMSEIATRDTLHILGYNPLVAQMAARDGGDSTIKDEALLEKIIQYQMSPEQLEELSKSATQVVGYDKETFDSYYKRSFTSYVEDDPAAAEFMKQFVASTVDDPHAKEILDSLDNVMKGYVIKETMAGRNIDSIGAKEFANEIMQSFLSDYHVMSDADKKTTFFIEKENFDPKMEQYISAYGESLKNDPAAFEKFQTTLNSMDSKTRDYYLGQSITTLMNEKLQEYGMGGFVNSAAPQSIVITTAEEAAQYSQMLKKDIQPGDMVFSIQNIDQQADVPIFITQDEVMENMLGRMTETSRFQSNWDKNVKVPQYKGSWNMYQGG